VAGRYPVLTLLRGLVLVLVLVLDHGCLRDANDRVVELVGSLVVMLLSVVPFAVWNTLGVPVQGKVKSRPGTAGARR